MVPLDVRLPGLLRQVLRSLVETAAAGAAADGPRQADPPPGADEDLRDFWVDEVRAAATGDAEALLAVLRDPAFGTGVVEIPDARAEAVLRGCSVIRLRLRETALAAVDDLDLERGQFEEQPPPELATALLCYAMLGHLQEYLVAALDPAVHEGAPDDEEDEGDADKDDADKVEDGDDAEVDGDGEDDEDEDEAEGRAGGEDGNGAYEPR